MRGRERERKQRETESAMRSSVGAGMSGGRAGGPNAQGVAHVTTSGIFKKLSCSSINFSLHISQSQHTSSTPLQSRSRTRPAAQSLELPPNLSFHTRRAGTQSPRPNMIVLLLLHQPPHCLSGPFLLLSLDRKSVCKKTSAAALGRVSRGHQTQRS